MSENKFDTSTDKGSPSTPERRDFSSVVVHREKLSDTIHSPGSTAAFITDLLKTLDGSVKEVQALILAPSCELARETWKSVDALGVDYDWTSHIVSRTARPAAEEDRNVLSKRPPQVVVGTPHYSLNLVKLGHLRTNHVKTLCLNSTDILMERGFKDDILALFKFMPAICQVSFICGTMPEEVIALKTSLENRDKNIVSGTASRSHSS